MALIQKTIEVPAVPASTKKINIRICDDCGREMGVPSRHCRECGAELCSNCYKYHQEDAGGDYPDYICSSCNEVLISFEAEVDELQEKLDVLYELRQTACKEKRKKKNETNKT